MPRADVTKYLIHWIKGGSYEEAFDVLRQIVMERCLHGGNGHIKGGYVCACFTEAPEDIFHDVISRYQPFGIRVSKRWLYEKGGRPVIYQADEEFGQLRESHKWRHVRYDPNSEPPIDFSWEREWRILTDELFLPPGKASIIVPHESWAMALEQEHFENEHDRIQMEAIAYGDEWLLKDPRPFFYHYSVINL